jgi:hypothetical protein
LIRSLQSIIPCYDAEPYVTPAKESLKMPPAEATIDHPTLTKLVDAGAVRGAHVVAQPKGWTVRVKYGRHERPLAALRSRQVRTWRKLDTVAQYLHGLGLSSFDVDATGFDPAAPATHPRPDRAQALKRTYEAAEYDKWFREREKAAMEDPSPDIPGEVVEAKFAAKREALRRRIEAEGL